MRRPVLAAACGALALSCVPLNLGGIIDGAAVDSVNDLAAHGGELIAKGQECQRLAGFDIPLEEETALGGAVAVKWVSQGGGLVVGTAPQDELTLYVDRVGRNLAMQSGRPLIDWTFGVLESDDFNALSAPGGYVLVTRGLLRAVDNEAQLAGVLAHEIAHVTEKHAITAYRKVRSDACYSAFGGMVLGRLTDNFRSAFAQALSDGAGQALKLDEEANFEVLFSFTDTLTKSLGERGFEAQQEYDADRIGLALVIGAGYNPHEYVKFLAKIPEGGTSFPHHPSNADRQQHLARFLESYQGQPDFYPDYPFDRAPTVPLHGELAAAAAKR